MPALVLTYVVGVLFNFYTTRRFVFAARGDAAALLRFIAAYVLIYFFNLVLYTLIERGVGKPLLAQALCVPVVAVFSFLLFKFQVFRDR
jgi:putative flippase GtrA